MDMEQEIKAAGAGVAPRVTPADIEAAIASEHYFIAAQGDAKAQEDAVFAQGGIINAEQSRPIPEALDLLTFCVLVLKNGFTITGESACASPENFNAEIGRKIARENAVQKVWPLLGFRLRDRLAAAAIIGFDPTKQSLGDPTGVGPSNVGGAPPETFSTAMAMALAPTPTVQSSNPEPEPVRSGEGGDFGGAGASASWAEPPSSDSSSSSYSSDSSSSCSSDSSSSC